MNKLEYIKTENITSADYLFFCPGCEVHHAVWTTNETNGCVWNFNGNLELPTFQPSIKISYPTFHEIDENGFGKEGTNYTHICHTFITDGKIQFLSDCTHKLAGQTIDMLDID